MDSNTWQRLPEETPTAFNAFCKYRALSLDGEGRESRSLVNVSQILGHKSTSTVEGWSSKYNWVERAASWDEKRRNDIIKVQDVGLEEFQQAVISQLTLKLTALSKIVNAEINAALEGQAIGERVPAVELKRLVDVVATLDTLARRAANMPTTFRSEGAQNSEETQTYIMGMDDE